MTLEAENALNAGASILFTDNAPLGQVFTLQKSNGILRKTEIDTGLGPPLQHVAVMELENPLVPAECVVLLSTIAFVAGTGFLAIAWLTPTAAPTGIAALDALPSSRVVLICDTQGAPPGPNLQANLSFMLVRIPSGS